MNVKNERKKNKLERDNKVPKNEKKRKENDNDHNRKSFNLMNRFIDQERKNESMD